MTRGSSGCYAATRGRSDRRLTAQGQERKEQLLDAAAALFAERGYAETRIVDICRDAGVAKGLFYWYFENKEALFRDLVDGIRLAAAPGPGARRWTADAEPLVQLRQGTEASVRFMATHAQFFALIAVENVDKQFVDDLRKGTEVHADDAERSSRAGIAAGLDPRRGPRAARLRRASPPSATTATSTAPAASTWTSTSWPPFVGRLVVCSLAADEEIARRVLAAQAYVPAA